MRTCPRPDKKRYDSQMLAVNMLWLLRIKDPDLAPSLQPYRCPDQTDLHWHLGRRLHHAARAA
jgi:hypothetical protein